jgi:hypothetical protein
VRLTVAGERTVVDREGFDAGFASCPQADRVGLLVSTSAISAG